MPGLAVVLHLQGDQGLTALFELLSKAPQVTGTHRCIDIAPGGQRLTRRRNGLIHLRCAGARQLRERLAQGWIEHVDRLGAFAR